ncbi:MAG: HpcH/HpaI aldolase/citrate lyase family protein [Clostridiales bacterium]|nr:HpcH/HpaI aldolase/citrate lyase family protein [Clostridiales bacterium]MDD6936530.1 aldolase/citrate lyase family protein [Clostridiales bacterium]MDY2962582.1 aldolase/citrate lyase family protein [Oscillospiraceae bacterium]
MLKLMYITNDPRVARIAVDAGVDRIFIDMEVLGKAERQGHVDSVKSHHVPEDIRRVRAAIGDCAEILARVNPCNPNTQAEIDAAIANGADIVMLPMWKTARDVQAFLACVGGRARTMPLLETREAAAALPEALRLGGVDEWFIGLNDLHLSYGRKFMFELLADGTVDHLCAQMRRSGASYGFGGVARPGTGTLPAESILGEHYRLGSQSVILSRSFCDTAKVTDYDEIERIFREGIADIRRFEAECAAWTEEQLMENHRKVGACVQRILAAKESS